MKTIKFSNDYEKLPEVWEGTQAKLIGVCSEKTLFIKNGLTAFWNYDTKIRGKDKHYPLDFEDALILTFIHLNTGKPFTTIRRNYREKAEYYMNSLGETFLMEVQKNEQETSEMNDGEFKKLLEQMIDEAKKEDELKVYRHEFGRYEELRLKLDEARTEFPCDTSQDEVDFQEDCADDSESIRKWFLKWFGSEK